MTRLFLLEPESASRWFPFHDARPVAELRAGAWLIRERWEAIAEAEASATFGPAHLQPFTEEGAPPVSPRGPVEGPAFVGRSDFAPAGVHPSFDRAMPAAFANDGETVGWWVAEGATWDGPDTAGAVVELDGVLLHGAWDLVTALEHLLPADCADFVAEGGDPLPDGSIVLGDPHDIVLMEAAVEPGVVFDVRQGAVIVERGAHVFSGTRLTGPCYIGPGALIVGGPVGHAAIGPRCKVRGEVSHAVFLGFANKGHDGFIGHSVIGRWANLGAGTTTSNLKNTYGPVRLEIDGARVETGRQFLGTLVGDHAKTAIGTMFSTGSLVGVGANVFGTDRPARRIAPFAWGAAETRMSREGFLEVAERVMPRRGVEVDDGVRAMFDAIYDHAVGP